MQNPLRDEGSAFTAVLLTLGAATLIVVGAWIETWLGVAVFAVIAVAVLAVFRGSRRDRVPPLSVSPPDSKLRLLVVANETVAGEELIGLIRSRVTGRAHDVLVVSPALNSKLATWVSDEDRARAAAQERLDHSLGVLGASGVAARGQVGDANPVQAIEDALRSFPANEIVISTHPPGRSNWLERGLVRQASARFAVPLSHIVVDLQAAKASETAA